MNSFGDNVISGCTCYPGYSGTASFYLSSCSVVTCPSGSHGAGTVCQCDAGYSGQITPTSTSPFYVNGCTPELCPQYSFGINRISGCTCRPGFSGYVSLSSSSCAPVHCPPNSNGELGTCTCNAGYKGIVISVTQSPYYESSCRIALCPTNTYQGTSKEDGGDGSACVCPPGFFGTVTPSVIAPLYYTSNCQAAPCPEDTNGDNGMCTCNAGFSGSVTALAYRSFAPYFIATCLLASCPLNSNRNGELCTCNAGYNGTVTATTQFPFYTSGCTAAQCPVN